MIAQGELSLAIIQFRGSVKHSAFTGLAIFLTALLLAGCDSKNDKPDILDAAAIYTEQSDSFVDILLSYPAPFTEFTRIPARDPAKEVLTNKRFITRLRKTIPVEFIDFFPRSEAGRDEIDVVIKRYSANNYWTVVSLIYLSKPLSPASDEPNKALFDKCDDRSTAWLELNKEQGPVTAICRINEHWYAVQKIG